MVKNKIYSKAEIAEKFHDGMKLMAGIFACKGCADRLVDIIVEKGCKNIELISNDAGDPGVALGKLYDAHLVSKAHHSHIGMNPYVTELINQGIVTLELIPQGTLAEKIRAGGAGLGGVLTKTGLGTIAEEGRQIMEIDGQKYIFEKPFRAEIAIIRAAKADKLGNLVYQGAARNFNPMMAMAADLVIVEADEIVEIGALDPEAVVTPGVFVDMILSNEE
ncbi:3-oxoacid CoA-transferase subunit A [Bisgaard Taxon 10/6]|uniref:3-oxoacid CoA-transferase subunit A n=1 Tax=Exercitatus varius TaxID=67857 RepID=A0ABT6ESF3_9PAST|nr:3-oxoacid CoA-transferase subunit A [Exercitatus varius]MDG2939782.1 3-oxoacid CoA-transferase subunit A [Exercitatus varius]MDG2946466.1 3-oxoacid CoA-transferase subunit A [Exercitatus varius]